MADNQDDWKDSPQARGGLLFRALRQGGSEEDLAFAATQEVIEMAGHNISAVLRTHRAELSAHIAELNAKVDALRWMLMAVLALLAALTTLGIISLRTAPAPTLPVVIQAPAAAPQDAAAARPADAPASQGQR